MMAWRTRGVVAAAIVAGCVIAACALDSAWDVSHPSDTRMHDDTPSQTYDGYTRALDDADWENVAVGLYADIAGVGFPAGGMPDEFSREVMGPGDLEDARFIAWSDVVGMLSPLNAQEAQGEIDRVLAQRGWKKAASGSSYMKDKGVYRWLYLNATDYAEGSTMVFCLMRASP